MRGHPGVGVLLLAASLLAAACQGAPAGGATPAQNAQVAMPQRLLRIVTTELPTALTLKPLAGGSGTGVAGESAEYVLNATLGIADERARVSPYLAQALPQLNTSTWQLSADGTMRTVYQLRPNLTWHDGRPLTADDFVFAWEVYRTPEYGVDRSIPIRYISGVEAPDPLTVVISWSQRFVNAGILQEEFPPLPRHLLEAEQAQGGFLPNSSFWTTGYVGAGPYRLESFVPGVEIEVSAFDRHVLGRPKIDRVHFRPIPNINTALAAVLAGEVDFGNDLFRAEEGQILERDWASTGRGVVLWEPLGSRTLQFQFNPEYASPQEVSDLRFRRAIAHAIDKRESFEAVTAGKGLMSDTRTHPGLEWHAQVDREITKYPYDPRRAEQLLLEAGFTRSGNQWLTPRATTVELPIWYTGGSSLFERENLIIVDQLKRFGIDAQSKLFPTSASREDRARLPGMIAVGSADPATYHSINIPSAENRYSGGNRGHYSNPEVDRLVNALDQAIAPNERLQLTIQLEKLISAELPGIFLYFHSRAFNAASSLKGPKVRQAPGAGYPLRNIYEWEWTS